MSKHEHAMNYELVMSRQKTMRECALKTKCILTLPPKRKVPRRRIASAGQKPDESQEAKMAEVVRPQAAGRSVYLSSTSCACEKDCFE